MRWTLWLFVAACASTSTSREPARPEPPPGEPPSTPSGPSERECDELITYAVALGIHERSTQPGPTTTQADHEAVRRKLRDDFLAGCRALPRDAYRCAISATTLTALAACQPSPSSSTSNSSVAPGGMTPPAPRSP